MQTQPLPSAPKKKSNTWKWLLGGFVGLLVLGQLGKNNDSGSSTATTDTSAVMSTDTSTGLSETPGITAESKPQSAWSYYDGEDKMGAKWKTASVSATELLEFDFPYNGGSEATFTIRRKKGKTDIYLQVTKGQFITNVSDGGTCRIRFDSGSPKTYSTNGAADYSSDIIFFNSEQAILKRLKSAKKMVIEVEFYSEGNRQIEFDVANLKWI